MPYERTTRKLTDPGPVPISRLTTVETAPASSFVSDNHSGTVDRQIACRSAKLPPNGSARRSETDGATPITMIAKSGTKTSKTRFRNTPIIVRATVAPSHALLAYVASNNTIDAATILQSTYFRMPD